MATEWDSWLASNKHGLHEDNTTYEWTFACSVLRTVPTLVPESVIVQSPSRTTMPGSARWTSPSRNPA